MHFLTHNKARAIIGSFFALIILFEFILRIQQKLGPLYDLQMDELRLDSLSDVLNHVHPAGQQIVNMRGKKITRYFDENGIRLIKNPKGSVSGGREYKILFIGDSFIEGYDDENTLPNHAEKYFAQSRLVKYPIKFLNAGCASYSPAIFIPQVKMLLPKIQPDFVVVDIDETDLGDDTIRYERLVVRDHGGRIEAVKRTPLNEINLKVLLKIKAYPIYLIRFVWRVYHTRFAMPRLERKFRVQDQRYILSFSWDTSPNAKEKYDKEIKHFKKNLSELVTTLLERVRDTRKILFIYHPHLGHLKGNWNHFVEDSLNEITKANSIQFYNSTQDLKKKFGQKPENYYFPNDMHFNEEGLKIYSLSVAQKLLPLIQKQISPRITQNI